MVAKQMACICLLLCSIALTQVLASPMRDLDNGRRLYELDEDSLEDQVGRSKREEVENVINGGETNVRKPLIFKRETNVRKPLLFKRYTDQELSKMWYPSRRDSY